MQVEFDTLQKNEIQTLIPKEVARKIVSDK